MRTQIQLVCLFTGVLFSVFFCTTVCYINAKTIFFGRTSKSKLLTTSEDFGDDATSATIAASVPHQLSDFNVFLLGAVLHIRTFRFNFTERKIFCSNEKER